MDWVTSLAGAWIFGGLLVAIVAFVKDYDGQPQFSKRTRARLILTALFLPIAVPLWLIYGLLVAVYVAAVEIALWLGRLFRDAFGRA